MSRVDPEVDEQRNEWTNSQGQPIQPQYMSVQQTPYNNDFQPQYVQPQYYYPQNQNRQVPQREARQRAPANRLNQQQGMDPVIDEPELLRHQNGHVFDPFWTDNEGYPSQAEMYMARCGCSCCVGPCCSDVRIADWKRLLLTFTFWTIVVEFIMLIVEFVVGGNTDPSFGPLDIFFLKDTNTLINLGGKYLPYIYCKGHVFRYITPVVLHSGLVHYLFNMLFTYRVMLPREVYWGLLRTVVMYAVCGVGGSVLSLAIYPWAVSVGASGALCGIFGGYIVDVGRMWKQMSSQLKFAHGVNIVLYLVVTVVLGFVTEGVDNGAHLGGLLTGIFFGMIILQKKLVVRIIGAVCLAVTWILPTALLYPLIKIDCGLF